MRPRRRWSPSCRTWPTAGIWFLIVWLPILLVLGVLAVLAIAIARRFGVGRRTTGGAPPATGGLPPASPVTGDA